MPLRSRASPARAELKIPLTDEGMELALDMVEEQALAALFGDPQNEWSELLKGFVLRIERVTGQRGASSERDRRWAARQIAIVCDVISDLPPGVPVPEEHPIRTFIEVSSQHPEAKMEHAAEICTALASRDAAPDWEQVQAMLGVRRLGLRAIGLAPLASEHDADGDEYGDDLTDKRGEAPILRKIGTDDVDMEKDPELGLVDEDSIDTNVVTGKPIEKKDKVTDRWRARMKIGVDASDLLRIHQEARRSSKQTKPALAKSINEVGDGLVAIVASNLAKDTGLSARTGARADAGEARDQRNDLAYDVIVNNRLLEDDPITLEGRRESSDFGKRQTEDAGDHR